MYLKYKFDERNISLNLFFFCNCLVKRNQVYYRFTSEIWC
jgi:hypothetical protein